MQGCRELEPVDDAKMLHYGMQALPQVLFALIPIHNQL